MALLSFLLLMVLWAPPTLAATPTPYYSYYDPIYDSSMLEDDMMPQAASLGDSIFGRTDNGIGGFLSSFKVQANARTATEFTDNAKQSKTDRESDIAQNIGAGISAGSDWERHQLRFGANGNLKRFQNQVSENQDNYNLYGDGRLDIKDEWSLNANLNYSQISEERNDPRETAMNLSRLRNVQTMGGGVGIDFNGYPFAISTHSSYNRIMLEKLDGEAQGFRNRDVSRYWARVSYPINDDMRIFVQPSYSEEIYDGAHDAAGINRDSTAYEVLGGVSYNVTDITILDLGIGQMHRSFEDSQLDDTQGLSIDASLRWSPYENFMLNTTLTRTIESTTLVGVNDLTVTSGRLLPSLALSSELVATGELGMDRYEFANTTDDVDHDYLAGAGLNYLWNNSINTGIHYRYRRRLSDVADRDFYSNTLLVTLSCRL
jgi:hypothetical protein